MGFKLEIFCNLIIKLSKKYKNLNFVIPVHSEHKFSILFISIYQTKKI